MNLSSEEYRQLLANQFEILSLLSKLTGDSESSHKYQVAEDGVISGYGSWALAEIPGSGELAHLMSEKDQKFVTDVLTMYSFIYGQYEKLSESEQAKLDIEKFRFVGFDGNEDNGQYGFCNYLMNDLHRFASVLDFIDKNSWETNSHGMGDARLQQMLAHFKQATQGPERIEISTAEELEKFVL